MFVNVKISPLTLIELVYDFWQKSFGFFLACDDRSVILDVMY